MAEASTLFEKMYAEKLEWKGEFNKEFYCEAEKYLKNLEPEELAGEIKEYMGALGIEILEYSKKPNELPHFILKCKDLAGKNLGIFPANFSIENYKEPGESD